MQKLQDSVFSIIKTNNLSPAVFNYLQPSEDSPDKTPLGGILSDTKHGWLALGPKFCVVDLRNGIKVASTTFGASVSNFRTQVTSVVELPTPLTANSQQLVISLECEDIAGMVCVFHINGSTILRCIQTDVVVTQLAVHDGVPDGPFKCFDGLIMAGTKSGEIFVFDLNRQCLIQALNDTAQGFEHMVRKEENCANLTFLPLDVMPQIERQRELALKNDDHIGVLLNENSFVDNQYIFRNPDGTVRMKAKTDHIRATVIEYIPQLGSLAVGFNFGAFQIWNLMNLDLEFTSQVNVECLPVTHFGFQEPCDDPRAFCYLWVVFSVLDGLDEEDFPLAVMYSLTYQGKRMLSDVKCLYQEFLTATVRFQVELSTTEEDTQLVGGKCISCHTYSVNSALGSEGEDSMLNLCHLIWECWGENSSTPTQHGMLLFDLDQWYKDQMPATYSLQSNAFMSATCCRELGQSCTTLDVRLSVQSVSVYLAPARLEEHFYPNSLYYESVCLNTSESCVLRTIGIQRQIINSMDEVGPTALLNPTRLYNACVETGLVPLYADSTRTTDPELQRRYLLSVALESRLCRLLKRCAHDWATGSHGGVGCTLPFLVDWSWKRAIELKENARELTAPLFTSSAQPDRNVVRCLEHCVQQLMQLTGLLDAVLTKCCNLVVPDALSEMEDKYKAIGTVSLYFQVMQWFLRCGLLPERSDASIALPYPGSNLADTYKKRRMMLHRLGEHSGEDIEAKSSPLLYIDQLIEHELGGDRIREMWVRGGSEWDGLYPPPSLYALLRLYLLPDVPEEHKHSLVLYLLVDYSMVYDAVRHEKAIRRLMQFPTMFGLSNTAIKATQAFWHLDHRDFDFALDQLQCLTGNTLTEWQHSVVLTSLLAQKKSQAALQYLHVRKPAPIQSVGGDDLNNSNNRVNDHDKLEDWQSCCNLYLARGLVFEALDVIRMCVQNETTLEDKVAVLSVFYKGCRNTGQLSKLLQVALLPFEEDVFIKYLENCDESQTSDILIMYYLQQARYLEAEQYNNKLKQSNPRSKDMTGSLESLAEIIDREGARDTLVEVVCSSLPTIANTVANCAFQKDIESHIIAAKPMSVFVQAKSPKNKFTYKSSFIQDTIENASETWINKPMMRRGMKRALNVEETPFICTPKVARNRSTFSLGSPDESTPSKRMKLDLSGTPKTPKVGAFKSEQISAQVSVLLDMPEEPSPDGRSYNRTGAETPHSILKTRMSESTHRGAPSPTDSRYLGESDEDMDTASNHTHYSDSTNKHLRFTMPTESEAGSTPSPTPQASTYSEEKETRLSVSPQRERESTSMVFDSHSTTEAHAMHDVHPLESPPKKIATDASFKSKKAFKDSVKARRSLSISVNSSLSDDPNTSMESIADIPVTLINPRYSGERQRYPSPGKDLSQTENKDTELVEERNSDDVKEKLLKLEVPKTPKGRRSIRGVSRESTPLRSRSVTPERHDSPVISTPLRPPRITRSRSRTPEISPRSSPLEPILEQPRQEVESEPHPKAMLSAPSQLRSRSRTPDRIMKLVESPRLEAIHESPTKSDSPPPPTTRRSWRSRSCTPEIENSEPMVEKDLPLRRRAKTPDKLMSPKKDVLKSAKKPLSRLVLEANAAKTVQKEIELKEEKEEGKKIIECTPMKSLKQVPSLMDVTISPIARKSILLSSNDSISEVAKESQTADNSVVDLNMKSIPAFTMNESRFGKSVLQSYESSAADASTSHTEHEKETNTKNEKFIPAFTLSESYLDKSVLTSFQSSVADASSIESEVKEKLTVQETIEIKESRMSTSLNITNFTKSVLGSYQSIDQSIERDDANLGASTSKALSSLITSDSDIDVEQQPSDVEEQTENEKISKKKSKKEKREKSKKKIDDMNALVQNLREDCIRKEQENKKKNKALCEEEEDSEEIENDEEDVEEGDVEEEEVEDDVEEDVEEEEVEDEDGEEDGQSCQGIDTELGEAEGEETSGEASGSESVYSDGVISIMDEDDQAESLADGNSEYDDSDDDHKDAPTTDIESEKTSSNMDVEIVDIVDITKEEDKDSLNQGHLSLLTDDNSMKEDQSNRNDSMEIHTWTSAVENLQQDMETDLKQTAAVEIRLEVEVTPTDSKEHEEKMKIDSAKSIELTPQNSSVTIAEMGNEAKDLHIDVSTKSKDLQNIGVDLSHVERTPVKESPVPRTRRRAASTSSNKSKQSTKESTIYIESDEEDNVDKPIESRTPRTRMRTKSKASNKSATETEQSTPESDTMKSSSPARRRAKTPTITEGRKIITRRVSKDISMTNVNEPQEEPITPIRRSTRSRSKNIDDNVSIASGSSVASTRSKTSGVGESKEKSARKTRKSTLTTKPDLSVIPELTMEESKVEDSRIQDKGDIIDEYSRTRRLTRHQKSLLESWLEPAPKHSPRRALSRQSEQSHDDEDASSTSGFDAQSMDRMHLLYKGDFEGSPDPSEDRSTVSPDSIASDASKQRRLRMSRGLSESKTAPKAARIGRRASVSVVGSPAAPASQAEVLDLSPPAGTRSRRASFNKACEALHTPKGRRTSTDLRKGDSELAADSPVSEASTTPSRRARRTSSHYSSATSASAKAQSAERSKELRH